MFPFLLDHWANLSIIKSIQPKTITIAAASNVATATISAVSVTGTILFFGNQQCGDASLNPSEDFPKVVLTNSTTITADTFTANAGSSRSVVVTAVEFQKWAVNRVDYYTITSALTQVDLTISNVDTTMSVITYLGKTTERATYNVIRDSAVLQLLNSSTVRMNRGNGSSSVVAGVCVIQFNPGVIKSIQSAQISVVSGAVTSTATISAVALPNALPIYTGWQQTVLGVDTKTAWPMVALTDSTTLTATIGVSNAGTSNIRAYVVEFQPQWCKSKNANTAVCASGAISGATTISSISTASSVLSYLGAITNSNYAGNQGFATVSITSATSVFTQRGASINGTVTSSFEAFEFA